MTRHWQVIRGGMIRHSKLIRVGGGGSLARYSSDVYFPPPPLAWEQSTPLAPS